MALLVPAGSEGSYRVTFQLLNNVRVKSFLSIFYVFQKAYSLLSFPLEIVIYQIKLLGENSAIQGIRTSSA